MQLQMQKLSREVSFEDHREHGNIESNGEERERESLWAAQFQTVKMKRDVYFLELGEGTAELALNMDAVA